MNVPLQIIGRSSSHFTRVATLFAHELAVPFALIPLEDLASLDPAAYAGNPALKIPTLRTSTSLVFGAESICRALVKFAPSKRHIVWTEQLEAGERNAQELVWYCMNAQVQLIFGIGRASLPEENLYFVKARTGFLGALTWLHENLEKTLDALPGERDLSLFEVTLFCLLEHLKFRGNVPLTPYPALTRFAVEFGKRESAQSTQYHFDRPAPPPLQQRTELDTPDSQEGDPGHVLILHAVKNYAAWKSVFDGARELRKAAGELNYRVLRHEKDGNKVIHFSEWSSLQRARAFFESAELVEIRRIAGVEAPEFHYLTQLEHGEL